MIEYYCLISLDSFESSIGCLKLLFFAQKQNTMKINQFYYLVSRQKMDRSTLAVSSL